MGQFSSIPLTGTTRTTTRVNLRQGAPTTQAPIQRKLEVDTVLQVHALVVGDAISGNAHWYLTDNNAYVWAGGCAALQTAAPSVSAQVQAVTVSSVVSPIVRVVDISHGDAVTGFTDARNSGLLGVIHKATTGASGRDDAYRTRRDLAGKAGLLWGAYHWGTAAPIQDQVDNFLGWAEPDDQTLVALDFEPTAGNQMTLSMAREFLEKIIEKLGRKAVLYSGETVKSALGHAKDDFFGSHRLWLPQYGTTPKVQASWNSYWLWQYTDGEFGPNPKHVTGIPGDSNGRVDCNHFAGTEDDLRAQWV